MFNLVKWAFKLGQQTERHRIANVLADSRRYVPYGEYGTNNDKQKRDAITETINREVNRIIDRITEPNRLEESRYSVLYPREDK